MRFPAIMQLKTIIFLLVTTFACVGLASKVTVKITDSYIYFECPMLEKQIDLDTFIELVVIFTQNKVIFFNEVTSTSSGVRFSFYGNFFPKNPPIEFIAAVVAILRNKYSFRGKVEMQQTELSGFDL
jgi:hypothetical protein